VGFAQVSKLPFNVVDLDKPNIELESRPLNATPDIQAINTFLNKYTLRELYPHYVALLGLDPYEKATEVSLLSRLEKLPFSDGMKNIIMNICMEQDNDLLLKMHCILNKMHTKDELSYIFYFRIKYQILASPLSASPNEFSSLELPKKEHLALFLKALNYYPEYLVTSSIAPSYLLFDKADTSNEKGYQKLADARFHFYPAWKNLTSDLAKIAVAVHELGHQIHMEKFLQKENYAYLSTLYMKNNLVSGYAQENYLEFIAETITSYILRPNYLKTISYELYNHVKYYYFHGIEFNQSNNRFLSTQIFEKMLPNEQIALIKSHLTSLPKDVLQKCNTVNINQCAFNISFPEIYNKLMDNSSLFPGSTKELYKQSILTLKDKNELQTMSNELYATFTEGDNEIAENISVFLKSKRDSQ
jgi:hypothetical protein